MAVIHGTRSITDVLPSLDLRFSLRKDLVDSISGKNLIDFSRVQSGSSKSTYFGADGLLKYADSNEPRFDHDPLTGESLGLLVEEARTNSIKSSNNFIYNDWHFTQCKMTPNAVTAPDGTQTAALIQQTNGTSTRQFICTSYSVPVTGSPWTASVYVKKHNYDYVIFGAGDQDSGSRGSRFGYLQAQLRFQFSTKTLTVNPSTSWGGAVTESGYEELPNGWFRLWVSKASFPRANYWGIAVQSSFTGTTQTSGDLNLITGDGVSGVYFWGMQWESGGFRTSHIPTPPTFVSRADSTQGASYYDANGIIQYTALGAPRNNAYFPDSNGVFHPAGLLLEAASTNSFTYSNDLTQSVYSKNNVILSVNSAIAPDGTNTATKVIPTTDSVVHSISRIGTLQLSSMRSVYVKAAEYTSCTVYDINTGAKATINLITGNITNASYFNFNVYAEARGRIRNVGNGWWRIEVGYDTYSAVNNPFHIYPNNDSTFAGNGTSGILVWGYQQEANVYPQPTSYIPTDGTPGGITRAADVSSSSTIQRTADVVSITGTNFSSWYNSNQGTFFTDCNSLSLQSAISRLAYNSSHTGAFALGTGAPGSGRMYAQLYSVLTNNTITVNIFQYNGGGTDFGPRISNVIPLETDVQKVAFYTDPPNQLYAIAAANKLDTLNTNSGKTGDYSYTFADMMRIGYNSGYYGNFNGTISRLTYYPQRLPDTTLQKLTT